MRLLVSADYNNNTVFIFDVNGSMGITEQAESMNQPHREFALTTRADSSGKIRRFVYVQALI